MTVEQIKNMVSDAEYDFLRQNPHLKDKIIFLTLGGSYAYGTNVETSDVDIRGCAVNSCSDLLGLTKFEQFIDNTTDTTVYSFNKLIGLLLNCNPNTIEMLGCKPEHYIQKSQIGEELIANRKLFLSKRAVHSFGGYANQQLRRLENALAEDEVSQAMKEKHLLKSMQGAIESFKDKYTAFENGSMVLYTAESPHKNSDTEIFADIHIDKYPIREFNSVLNELTNITRTYEELNHRNRKKDNNSLNKHAMHLIRLFLMCLDILEKEDIITYREQDRDLLLAVRLGEFQNENGSYRTEFFDMVNELERRFQYAQKNTSLPKTPNMKQIEEFVVEVNKKVVGF